MAEKEKRERKEPFICYDDLAVALGYKNGEKLRQAFKEARNELGLLSKDKEKIPTKVKIAFHKDGTQEKERIIQVHNEEDLLDSEKVLLLHKYDPNEFELVDASHTMWDSITNGDLLFASKIKVKPRTTKAITRKDIECMFKDLERSVEPIKYEPKQYEKNGEMLELCLFDVHFSKLACAMETGENYDFKIARDKIIKSVEEYLSRLKDKKFEKILFPFGNDFFNSATIEGTTIHGTQQDNDLRWSKMFIEGTKVLVQVIELLRQVAPVELLFIGGNHDLTVSFYAAMYLHAYYKDVENVKIDTSPMTRKYYQFGINGIGFAHGDQEKKRISGLMQIEAPEMWANTRVREWHIGHLHKLDVVEENGVVIRTMPSITSTDAWHYQNGYVGALKRSCAFVWDKEKGLVETIYVSI